MFGLPLPGAPNNDAGGRQGSNINICALANPSPALTLLERPNSNAPRPGKQSTSHSTRAVSHANASHNKNNLNSAREVLSLFMKRFWKILTFPPLPTHTIDNGEGRNRDMRDLQTSAVEEQHTKAHADL